MAAGQHLKLLRNKRKVTVRDVEQASRRIAEAKGDKRFQISNGWLAQLENGASEPSICKLFSLSVIYHANLLDLLRLYNVDVDNQEQYEPVANPHLTQLVSQSGLVDVRVDSESSHRATSLISGIATQSATPLTLKPGNGNTNITYGYLGSNDLTMYPQIRPGSLVQIDTSQTKLLTTSWHNEFERPIYFVELREGYACGWCELQSNQLLIIPHHSSPVSTRRLTYPREAEIVGRVVGYYTRCVDLDVTQNANKALRQPEK